MKARCRLDPGLHRPGGKRNANEKILNKAPEATGEGRGGEALFADGR